MGNVKRCQTCKNFKTMEQYKIVNAPAGDAGKGNPFYSTRCLDCFKLYGNKRIKRVDGKIRVTKHERARL